MIIKKCLRNGFTEIPGRFRFWPDSDGNDNKEVECSACRSFLLSKEYHRLPWQGNFSTKLCIFKSTFQFIGGLSQNHYHDLIAMQQKM